MQSHAFAKYPHTIDHSHFGQWVSDFPSLHQHHHDHHDTHHKKPIPKHEQTFDYLRAELKDLVNNRPLIEKKLCYRNCFKQRHKDDIEFCLQENCGNPNFNDAARALNLLR